MIAIPNMELPPWCGKCILQDGEICYAINENDIGSGLSFFDLEDLRNFCIKRRDDCPLIEIEDTEYEWCHDCKEYDRENHCCPRWSKTIWKTVAELEEFYGKYITKHDQTLVIDYPNTDDIEVIRLMDEEGFTRVFVER